MPAACDTEMLDEPDPMTIEPMPAVAELVKWKVSAQVGTRIWYVRVRVDGLPLVPAFSGNGPENTSDSGSPETAVGSEVAVPLKTPLPGTYSSPAERVSVTKSRVTADPALASVTVY